MALRYKQQKAAQRRADASAKVMQWARAAVGDDESVGVSVGGSVCGHAACAGEETIILLMRPHQPTVAFTIAKSLETVTQADVVEALLPVASMPHTIRVG